MEQALIGVLALAVGIAVGYAARTRMAANRLSGAEHEAERVLTDARSQASVQLVCLALAVSVVALACRIFSVW